MARIDDAGGRGFLAWCLSVFVFYFFSFLCLCFSPFFGFRSLGYTVASWSGEAW